jgi:O-antigen ligase
VALGLALVPENSLLARWFWCALGLVMGISVVLSGSRGGAFALAAELLLLTLVVAALRGGRRAILGLLAAIVLTAGAVWALDEGQAFQRYKATLRPNLLQQEEAGRYRLEAWYASLVIFRQHWLLGSGLDTFGNLFPAARSFPTDKIWTHAHNDFLQFLAETGLVGALLAGWILWVGGRAALQNFRRARDTATGAMLLGIATGSLGFLVHGWLDFNFHIPANASNFAVLAALLTRSAWNDN